MKVHPMNKRHMISIRLVLPALLFLGLASTGHANHLLISKTQCTHAENPVDHTIEIIYTRPDKSTPCRVYHTKSKERQRVGMGNNTPTVGKSCESIEKNITANLRNGGYQCTQSLTALDAAPQNDVASVMGRNAVDHGRYAIQVGAFKTEGDAQIFAAAVKRALPFVPVHLRRLKQNANSYTVYAGAEISEDAARLLLKKTAGFADSAGQVVDLFALDEQNNQVSTIPSDWQRYAVSSCFKQGQDTQRKMARCSGLLLESRLLTSCLHAGFCRPPQVQASVSRNLEAVLAAIPDRVLVEGRFNVDQIETCHSDIDGNTPENTLIDCGLPLLLTEDQRKIFTCGMNASTQSDALSCIAGPRLGPSEKQILTCLEKDGADASLSRCVFNTYSSADAKHIADCYDNRVAENFASCVATKAHVGNEERVATCTTEYGDDPTATGLCVAGNYLTTRQKTAISCWSRTQSLAGFGVCAFGSDLGLTAEQKITAKCAATSGNDVQAFAACAGGRLTAQELEKCVLGTIGADQGCFGENTIIAEFRRATLSNPQQHPGQDHPIAVVRASLLGIQREEATGALDAPESIAVDIIEAPNGDEADRADVAGEEVVCTGSPQQTCD